MNKLVHPPARCCLFVLTLCFALGRSALSDESPSVGVGPTSAITIDLSSEGEVPIDRSAQLFAAAGTRESRPLTSVQWEAVRLVHRPLYFEDEAVERNGQYRPVVQPIISAAHFFGRIPALPYLMAGQPPGTCVYPLGMTRPGSCVEPYYRQWPRSAKGGLTEAGVMAGLIFLIP
ncbi:MAG: hypothetical protein ABGX22_17890 [Pirellulaceae bacterium]